MLFYFIIRSKFLNYMLACDRPLTKREIEVLSSLVRRDYFAYYWSSFFGSPSKDIAELFSQRRPKDLELFPSELQELSSLQGDPAPISIYRLKL